MRFDTRTVKLMLDTLGTGVPPLLERALKLFLARPTDQHRAIVQTAFSVLPPERRVEIELDLAEATEAGRDKDEDPTPGLTRLIVDNTDKGEAP